MNIQWHSPSSVEDALGREIKRILSQVTWLQDIKIHGNPAPFQRAFDWLAEFTVSNGPRVQLWIDCKTDPRPAHFPYVCVEHEFDRDHRTKRTRARVFGAPYLSPRMRELCQKHGWNWYDLAGNCRISLPGILHLERTGNPPVHQRAKPEANLSTPETGAILRALLAPENAGVIWTQRLMESHFGQLPLPLKPPSLGLINKVVRHLREEAYVEVMPKGGFRLMDPLKLLVAWRDVYRFERHERLGYFTLLKGKALQDALTNVGRDTKGYAAFAAYSAAEFQAPHVRQSKSWLYVRSKELLAFEKLVQAKPVDSGENIIVLIPGDDGVFYMNQGGDDRMARTNEVQTYIDLWHCGGRGHEAAEALLEQRLKPRWRSNGFAV